MVKWYTAPELQLHHDRAFGNEKSDTRTLPPGHDNQSFQRALGELRAIVGKDNLLTDEELANFRDPYPLFEDGFNPSAGLWYRFRFNVAIFEICAEQILVQHQ